MHSTKQWGWVAWAPCNVVCMHAVALTASPGPPTTETVALHKGISDRRTVSGPRTRDGPLDYCDSRKLRTVRDSFFPFPLESVYVVVSLVLIKLSANGYFRTILASTYFHLENYILKLLYFYCCRTRVATFAHIVLLLKITVNFIFCAIQLVVY